MRTAKTIATHFVDFARIASVPLDLFFERKVSAAPEIAPDRPAFLPDWKITTPINAIQTIRCAIWRTNVIKLSFLSKI